MAGKAKEAGPSSQRVAANLRHIRRERDLTTAAISRRLAEIGHPIADTGITKIEKGDRRVDVDDLVALAVALDTTPNRLLLPEVDTTRPSAELDLTPDGTHGRIADAWAWASGERPLGSKPSSRDDEQPAREELRFIAETRRHYIRGAFEWLGVAAEWMGREDDEEPRAGAKVLGKGLVALAIISAYDQYGVNTADLRAAAESGIVASLIQEKPEGFEDFADMMWDFLARAEADSEEPEPDR